VPSEFLEEMSGFAYGCQQAMPMEYNWCEKALGRIILLANAPGSVKDVVFVLIDEVLKIKGKSEVDLDERELEGLKEINEIEEMLVDTQFTIETLLESLSWPLA
jgi:hypothetical protein